MREIRILPAAMSQAPEIARLCTELGYPSTTAEVKQRLEQILRNPSHTAFAATDPSEIVLGWVHLYEVYLLMVGRFAEVGGLIVSKSNQGQGVGSRLMEQAETWALERGISRICLRSNIQREDAHHFYQSRGYSIEKTSYTLTKLLPR